MDHGYMKIEIRWVALFPEPHGVALRGYKSDGSYDILPDWYIDTDEARQAARSYAVANCCPVFDLTEN